MARKRGGTAAIRLLVEQGIDHTVHSYEHDPTAPSYGLEAAAALGVDPERVFKTLLADVDGELVVGIVPVSSQLDLKALATAVDGKRAVMADPRRVERITGYVVGGISPVGQKRRLRTVLDVSARGWPTIMVSAGKRGLEIELSPDDLVRTTAALVAPLAR
ncbi:MAG TPA: Cys-tRNA(Pro) deacylase [Marmoricola sp.]|nr:Cys-tRNA(Pro) deacylase [Marmoricola sp.]